MQMLHNCSFICTDPKGEILRSCGQMLKDNGYNVKVINLLEMEKSDGYNPFSYIREKTDASGETARDNLEEGGDDVKSSCPL